MNQIWNFQYKTENLSLCYPNGYLDANIWSQLLLDRSVATVEFFQALLLSRILFGLSADFGITRTESEVAILAAAFLFWLESS